MPIPVIRDDELLDKQPQFTSPPPLIDPCLEKILADLSPKEKLERYYQDLAADEYMYGPTVSEETLVTEYDNPVSTLSRPRKINSLCKNKTESSPAALEINDSEFEGVQCIYNSTRKKKTKKKNYAFPNEME